MPAKASCDGLAAAGAMPNGISITLNKSTNLIAAVTTQAYALARPASSRTASAVLLSFAQVPH